MNPIKPGHDLSLHSGERQTATDYEGIRGDHRFRYEWADQRLPVDTYGLDAFCGVGYGTWLLSERRFVLGLDGSADAIATANASYRRSSNLFTTSYFPFDLPSAAFDFVVSLESIEHVADGAGFFAMLCRALKPGGNLIFSTPCEEWLPHAACANHFHHRHYTLAETLQLVQSHGLELVSHAGQDCYRMTAEGPFGGLLPIEEMQLRDAEPGQFTIVHARC
ncbi:MAG: class I SAM-dependent methyltransferase [Synechococcus sp.]